MFNFACLIWFISFLPHTSGLVPLTHILYVMSTSQHKLTHLQDLFRDMKSVLVAFSGGIDSTVVFKVAHTTLGPQAMAVTATSPTLPAHELEDAHDLAKEIGGRHRIIETNQLTVPAFTVNDASRCYHCKTDLYRLLEPLRQEEGFAVVVDGTNLDDLGDDRPGLSAAREWHVRSPLLEAELSKRDIRTLGRELGLSNWDKPAAACLSSRIPRGTPITLEKLTRVEQAEAVLVKEGFRQIRVRDQGDAARIEVGHPELQKIAEPDVRERVTTQLKQIGFRFVTVDLEGYQRGGGN